MLDTVGSQPFQTCSLIDAPRVRQQVEKAVLTDVPVHEADRAWAAIMPYFWEEGFHKPASLRLN